MTRSAPAAARRAFTLVEILVATAVMAILTGMVLGITTHVVRVWENASGSLSAENQAQLALDALARDLETAVLRGDGDEWMQIAVEDGIGAGAFTAPSAVHLMFFTSAPDRPRLDAGGAPLRGGLTAVSYRLAYRDPFTNSGSGPYPRFGLYRAVMDPENTFTGILAAERQEDLRGQVWNRDRPAGWTDLSRDGRNPSPRQWSTDVANLLAGHVVEFDVRIRYVDTRGDARGVRISGREGGRDRLRVGPTMEVDGTALPVGRMLEADVRLTILTEEGAALLFRERDDIPGNDRGWTMEEIIRREGETFTRRIAFFDDTL